MNFERERQIDFWCVIAAIAAMLLVQNLITSPARSEEPAQHITSHGLTVYFGVVPAAIAEGIARAQGERNMHGPQATAAHSHHLIVAIFNSGTGERVTDATVTAKITQPGFEPPEKPLEPMKIADTVTYGNFFDLSRPGVYRIRLSVSRTGTARPIMIDLPLRPSHSPAPTLKQIAKLWMPRYRECATRWHARARRRGARPANLSSGYPDLGSRKLRGAIHNAANPSQRWTITAATTRRS